MDYLSYALLGLSVVLSVITLILLILLRKNATSSNDSFSNRDMDSLKDELRLLNQQMHSRFDSVSVQMSDEMKKLTSSNYEQMLKIQSILSENAKQQTDTIQKSIQHLQEGNEKKLDEMRRTVDEKLTETLNRRINSSFQTVSDQLSKVYKSLGEMKELSAGVTDNVKGLNRILTNVKARGTWAELQLEKILDEIIPGMYERNVKTNPQYNGQVEFAIKIPNAGDKDIVYLPIDSKFPM